MLRPSITMLLILSVLSRSLRRQSTPMEPAGDVFRQPFAVGRDHVTLEQSQEFLLLRRGHNPRETSENKAAEAWDVEVVMKQLAKSRPSLLGEGVPKTNWLIAVVLPHSRRGFRKTPPTSQC